MIESLVSNSFHLSKLHAWVWGVIKKKPDLESTDLAAWLVELLTPPFPITRLRKPENDVLCHQISPAKASTCILITLP